MRDEITYPCANFIATVEVWEWISNFTPHFTGRNYLSKLGFNLIHIKKWHPGDRYDAAVHML